MKKTYNQPEVQVLNIQPNTTLLVGSGATGFTIDSGDPNEAV